MLRRGFATTSSASAPTLKASVLLSRNPLLTPTPHPLAQAYFDRSMKIRHALSNPTPTQFYFKPGSLPMRRYQLAEHAREVDFYGKNIAGAEPEVGDVQGEPEVEVKSRDEFAKADAGRGERSLERAPEEEVFLLVKEKGKWTFPSTSVKQGEGLDQAVSSRVLGVDGSLDGKTLDTWLVTRKPIGVVRNGEERVSVLRFFLMAELFPSLAHPCRRAQVDQGVRLHRRSVAHC